MKAPGSPSSALQTAYLISPGALAVNSHFVPVEKPAPLDPQSGELHFIDHFLPVHVEKGVREPFVSIPGDILIDLLRVNDPAIAQCNADLFAVKGDFLVPGQFL